MKRIRCLVLKEVAQIRRDRRLFGLLVFAPLLQLLLLGNAANTDIRNIRLAVRDHDHSHHSREFVRAVGSSGYFRVTTLTGPEGGDAQLLVSSRAGLVLVIPEHFGEDLVEHRPATVQVLVDGADNNFAVQGVSYLEKAARQYSEGLALLPTPQAPDLLVEALPAVICQTRIWYNPDLRSSLYLVPAIMALVLMVTTMIVTSMALVKEREEGTLEQLIVTPLRPVEIIAGKLLPFVVVGFLMVTLAIPTLVYGFGVPLRGSIALLYGISGLLLLNTLGLGVLVSTFVKTQQQAMMVSTFFIMMPSVLLSGFAFPVENMPDTIRAVAHLIPLRAYMVCVRGIFLKGVGWTELWGEALLLLAMGLAVLGLAVVKFRKRLD